MTVSPGPRGPLDDFEYLDDASSDVRQAMARALDGEPEPRWDLAQVRADGRRLRRRRRLRSAATMTLTAAAVSAVALAMPWSETDHGADPAGRAAGAASDTGRDGMSHAPSAAVTLDGSHERAVQEAELAADRRQWSAHAVAAVAGALRRDALIVPLEGVEPVHDVRGPQGELLGTSAWLLVDVVGLGERDGRADVQVELRWGYVGTGGLCGENHAIVCTQETRDDGSVLRRGEGQASVPVGSRAAEVVGAGLDGTRVVQVESEGLLVQVWSSSAVSPDGAELPPTLGLDQLERIAVSPFWSEPPPS